MQSGGHGHCQLSVHAQRKAHHPQPLTRSGDCGYLVLPQHIVQRHTYPCSIRSSGPLGKNCSHAKFPCRRCRRLRAAQQLNDERMEEFRVGEIARVWCAWDDHLVIQREEGLVEGHAAHERAIEFAPHDECGHRGYGGDLERCLVQHRRHRHVCGHALRLRGDEWVGVAARHGGGDDNHLVQAPVQCGASDGAQEVAEEHVLGLLGLPLAAAQVLAVAREVQRNRRVPDAGQRVQGSDRVPGVRGEGGSMQQEHRAPRGPHGLCVEHVDALLRVR
mmetsp:Transcript_11833/g.40365  ORF Transcript_11833/g.40365 Transcript_11833/m.40365 type:complete len:275 (+) Transcript_11833:66-890(+)